MLYCIVWESIDYLSIVLERLRPGRYLEFFICMKSERTIGRGQWSFKTGNLWELDDTCSSHSQTFDKFDRHPPTIIQYLKNFQSNKKVNSQTFSTIDLRFWSSLTSSSVALLCVPIVNPNFPVTCIVL